MWCCSRQERADERAAACRRQAGSSRHRQEWRANNVCEESFWRQREPQPNEWDADHGLAQASGLHPRAVRHVLRELYSDDCRNVTVGSFRKLAHLLGERWDADEASKAFYDAVNADRGRNVTYQGLYRWLARHTVRDAAGVLHRRPSAAPLFIRHEHRSLLGMLDTACSHRPDVVEPRRRVSLQSHLISVFTILREWGAPQSVCVAGLFHSVYETAAGHRSCDVLSARPQMRAVLGPQVERLISLFPCANRCSAKTRRRNGLWDAPLGSSFVVPGMLPGQPEMIEVEAELRAPLLQLYWANDLDQATPEELEAEADYAAGVLRRSREVLPLLSSGGVGSWMRKLQACVAIADGVDRRAAGGGRAVSAMSWRTPRKRPQHPDDT